MDRQINLLPALLLPEPLQSPSKENTDIVCHLSMMHVLFEAHVPTKAHCKRGTMKADIYAALNTINHGFADALESLKKLQAEGVLTVEYVQDQTVLAGELLAGINSMILNKLSTRELADREHFGKMRVTIE